MTSEKSKEGAGYGINNVDVKVDVNVDLRTAPVPDHLKPHHHLKPYVLPRARVNLRITNVDPLGEAALSLLREAAAEVRPLYVHAAVEGTATPGNSPLGSRDVYVAAMLDDMAVACGSIRELDRTSGEIRRMFVRRDYRRRHIGHALLVHLASEGRRLGYQRLCLETGDKQRAAMTLYEGFGFKRIAPFGEYVSDPTSVCYELWLDKI
jgi:putative acetyltransferase